VSSDSDGNLSGWAWSENYGWISFDCGTDGDPGTNLCLASNYQVTMDPDIGKFDDYAYSGNIGWISFNCNTGGDGRSSVCSDADPPVANPSDYKVQNLRLRTIAVKIDVTLQYNSPKPELAISRSRTFVFNNMGRRIFKNCIICA